MTLHSIEFSSRAKIVLRRVWRGIREWCGDAAYERYAQSHAKHSGCAVLLSREEFYLQQLHKRYANVSRCC
jgi:uncharacterized short protein YbdD (DUF466 family)